MAPYKPTNPLGPPLLAILAAAVFGLAYWLFGVGKKPFQFATAAALLYGGAILFTLVVAGLVWGLLKIVRRVEKLRAD